MTSATGSCTELLLLFPSTIAFTTIHGEFLVITVAALDVMPAALTFVMVHPFMDYALRDVRFMRSQLLRRTITMLAGLELSVPLISGDETLEL